MKLSKAFVSIASASALTISAIAMAVTVSASTTKSTVINDPSVKFDDSNIVASFGVMSDTHIFQTDTGHDAYFTNALSKLQTLAGGSGSLDGVLIAGDLCENGPLETYPRMKGLWESAITSDHTELIPAIGNHDDYFEGAFSGKNSFQDLFGSLVYRNPVSYDTASDITNGNYHTIINGIHVISVTGYDYDHTPANLEWLDNQLSRASKDNPYMPIIVESHVIPVDTVYGSHVDENPDSTRWYSTTIAPVLEKYPQVVYFAGHTHSNGHRDDSVWRGGYTAVGTGSTSDASCRDCKLLQIDKDGVVRMRAYSTNDNDATQAPLNQWVFNTMTPKATAPSDDEIVETTVPAADVLNVDFSNGTANDSASSIAAQTLGSGAQLEDSTAFGHKLATFDGAGALGYAFTDAQYNKMKNSTTLDCTFKVSEAPSSGYVDIVGNMNKSGQGFEYYSDHTLKYFLNIGGTYTTLEATNIEPNQWYNVVATYNGKAATLYVNGLWVDRTVVSGDITQPTGAARVFCIGADSSSTGNYENAAKVQIAAARVSGTALNDTQAYMLYSQDINTKIVIASADKYKVTQGSEFTFPTVTASDAVNGDVTANMTTALKNTSGNTVSTGGSYTPKTYGDYTVSYRVNGLVVSQTLTVDPYQMLDKTTLTLNMGDTATLVSTPLSGDFMLNWSSSDNSIASVDNNGKVTAVKAGTATITAKTIKGMLGTCTVTVVDPNATTTSTTTTTTLTTTSTGTDTTTTTSTETATSTTTGASVTTTTTSGNGSVTTEKTGNTNVTTATTDNGNSPKTGDSQSALPYALIVVSVLATGALVTGKKLAEIKTK